MINVNYYTPILLPLTGTISGIYAQSVGTFLPEILIAGCTIAMIILGVALYKRSTKLVKIFITVFAFFLGALLLYLQNAQQGYLIELLANKKIDVVALVTDKDDWMTQQGREQKRGEVLRLSCQHQQIPFDLLCYSRQNTSMMVGDTIKLESITIKPPQHSSGHCNPTYDDYLLKEQVLSAVFTTGAYQCKLISRPSFSLKRWLWTLRNNIYQSLKSKLSGNAGDYFGLIFLGNKQQNSSHALRTIFGYWGLSHYLARSGLHIILFIMIWTFLLRLVPLPGTIKRCILVMVCIVYDFLSWTSIPFVRAYYAFLLMKGGELLYQQINYLHILSILCLSILLFNPMQLFFLDFQLTFTLTFTLVFLSTLFSTHKK